MQRCLTLATLVLLLVSSISQAKTSRSAAPHHNRINESASEGNRNETATDYDVAITSDSSGGIRAGFGFLRKMDKGVIEQFRKAWHLSGAGINGRESVVLIFRMRDGSYIGKSQGFTNQYQRFTFEWNPAALAIVHTHPNGTDPEPGEQDRRVADLYGVPNFTISINGMYVYDPATKKTSKVLNRLDWLHLSTLTRAIGRSPESSPRVIP